MFLKYLLSNVATTIMIPANGLRKINRSVIPFPSLCPALSTKDKQISLDMKDEEYINDGVVPII